MGKLNRIRSNYSKSAWILACVLLFGFTSQVAAVDVYESRLLWDGDEVGSCVAVLDRMETGGNDLEIICGHDLADETVVVSIWKRSGEDLILVSYVGPVGNPFDATASLSDADVDELMLGNMIVSVAPTSREAEPVLGQIGVMDTGSNWAIMEMEKDGHMNGWCAATIGRLDERYEIGCMTPMNPDGGVVMVGEDTAFPLMGTTTLWASVMAMDLADPCTDDIDWDEFLDGLRAGEASVEVGMVGNAIPEPMPVADFATFAFGDGISTDVVIMNRHTTTDVSGYWIARGQNGYPVASETFGPLAPLAAATVENSGEGDLFVGTLTVKGDGPLGGLLRYNIPGLGVAGVLPSAPSDRIGLVVNSNAEFQTGIAIRNPESHDVTFEIRVIPPLADRSAADDYLAMGTVTLPPGGQVSAYASELVTCEVEGCFDGESFTGVAVVSSDNGAVEAVAFEVGAGRFTVLPVVPVVGP